MKIRSRRKNEFEELYFVIKGSMWYANDSLSRNSNKESRYSLWYSTFRILKNETR